MKIAAITAALLLSATTSFAMPHSSGHDQLANMLQVNGAEFTTGELISIRDARIDGNLTQERYFLSHENRAQAGGKGETSQGKEQLAEQLGVDASKYSIAELSQLQDAVRENDRQKVRFIMSGNNETSVDVRPTPSRGRDS
ncbi:hypothetical protein ERN12_10995 [Rhodobacteraceae bacterium]|nr:hypothetical protein ERN12_10995 [Paracoccaceae bacterium]